VADPNIVEFTVPEIQSLGERLYARGISKLTADTPAQQRDLRIAARLLWLLGVEVGAERVLRVEGA
jgi:hypothetical protein